MATKSNRSQETRNKSAPEVTQVYPTHNCVLFKSLQTHLQMDHALGSLQPARSLQSDF